MLLKIKPPNRIVRLIRRIYSTTVLHVKDQLPGPAYQPHLVEKNAYQKWEKDECFKPAEKATEPYFSMVLPPPNVTGKLHLGHALGCTIQDVIARRQRSLGKNILWLPGTDHAGIATQNVVEKYLKSMKNVTLKDLGRERFNIEVWNWKAFHSDTITKQLRSLGCSLDWSREVFTMDAERCRAVNNAFITLFSRDLIYRKKAMVNWCRALKSTVSDIEVDNLEIKGPTELVLPGVATPVKFGQLYSIAYKIFGTDEEIVVCTTNPETMLGDTAVAVNPNDKRYMHLRGKRAFHPYKNETIPIIFDEFVDMDFGTGAVKVTPAHSKVDYEVGRTHKLPIHQVIDENGIMVNAGEYTNMDKYACRIKLVNDLHDKGLLRGVQAHKMILPTCSRTGDVIEYLPKEQWFVSCKEMNKKARLAVENGKLKIEPDKFVTNWLNWTNDERDWCISRQLWWGHQIPAYKCYIDASKQTVWVAAKTEAEAKIKAAQKLNSYPTFIKADRDQDVLDTWFSSGIYPFAALGWPNNTPSFNNFYPLSLLATGHDILGLWVHRMVMLGLELTDRLPFHQVLLHGVICDNKGSKMSKSKGNVIDPIDVIQGISMAKLKEKSEDMHKIGALSKDELQKALAYHKSNFSNTGGIPECGVDALRFTLLSQDVKSHFVNFDVSMCHANKLFCNKIWQSLKYTKQGCSRLPLCTEEITRKDLTYFDKWILSRLADLVKKVNVYLDNHDFHLATKALRSHIYNEFCDVYLEATKTGFGNNNRLKSAYAHAHTLTAVLNTSLRCLNPFMVYLTQELIPRIPAFENNIIVNFKDEGKKCYDFPQYKDFESWKNPELESRVGRLLEAAALVRELKGLCGMSTKLRPSICIKTKSETLKQDLTNNLPVVLNLACCSTLDFAVEEKQNYIRGYLDKQSEVWVEVLGSDVENTIFAAKQKLQQRIQKLEKSLDALEKKYSSEKYLSSASESSKDVDKRNLLTKKHELKKIQADLEKIKDSVKV